LREGIEGEMGYFRFASCRRTVHAFAFAPYLLRIDGFFLAFASAEGLFGNAFI